MRPTQFLIPASGISERISGFTAHLRANGYTVGVRETQSVLTALEKMDQHDSHTLRLASRTIFATRADHYREFDALFDAYWFNHGRQSNRLSTTQTTSQDSKAQPFQPGVDESQTSSGQGESTGATDNDDTDVAQSAGDGRLVGSRITNSEKVDLREFMTPESIEEAQMAAKRLASAMRDRRSRRYIADHRGAMLDLRRIMRHSVSHGSEPFKLFKRRRPTQPVRIVTLLDVSGSMLVYSRIFLAFIKGLVSHDTKTDAYLFHTSLVRISDALREPHTLRAVNALSLKAQGFGGGTKIGHNIEAFNQQYAKHTVNGHTVVIILSDGYDTDPPEVLARALAKLKKRGCKLIWLNPLKSWKDYAPTAQGMQAALPYIDLFETANTLQSLSALESHLARL